MTLFYLAASWLLGIVLAGWVNPPLPALGLLCLPVLAVLFLWRRERMARVVAACGLAALLGAARMVWATPDLGPNNLASYNEAGPVTVTGIIDRQPSPRDGSQVLDLRTESLIAADSNTFPQEILVSGRALVHIPRYPLRAYGDRLVLTGDLETPPVFADFSYKEYLERQGVYSLMRYPRVELLEKGQGSPFWQAMYAVKDRAQQTIALILPEPHAALLTGILLGVESGIPRGLYEQFNLTGTTHIIVISGANIAVLCALLMAAGTRLWGRRPAVWVTIVGIGLYTLLVGADPPVVRAAFMGGLAVLAMRLGRQTDGGVALFMTAVVMTAINPQVLWDAGFQLSFAATAGLIWLARPIEKIVERWVGALMGGQHVGMAMGLASEALVVTLAAQLATLPLIVLKFGRLSPVSFLSNVLIVPVQPLVMMLGGLATGVGMVWLPPGQLLGYLAWLPLEWTILVVEWTSSLVVRSFEVQKFSWAGVLVVYAGLAVLAWWLNQRQDIRQDGKAAIPQKRLRLGTRLGLVGAAMVALLVWLALSRLPDGRLHVAVLDVGQGDAILITSPGGQQILVDGGPSPPTLLWKMGRHMPFWDRKLDMVVNTHPESDHLTGLPAVLERYQVDQVITSDVDSTSGLSSAWQAALGEEGAVVTRAEAGMRFECDDGLQVELLHPGRVSGGDNLNDHSVVLRLSLGQVSFLLAGDIEADVERRLVNSDLPLSATVLKVPHHGSATSSSPELLEAVNPRLAVVSVGDDNRFGHPEPGVVERYLERGIPLLRTDQAGTIELVTDGEAVWVHTER